VERHLGDLDGRAPADDRQDRPRVLRGELREAPLQIEQTAEDVAAAVVFLCGDGARTITGEALYVAGGL
jgi:enoyl-[acyl-carrier-protein] reductase (NADH)